MSETVTPSMHSRSSFQLKMDINWKACARTSNSLLSFHAPPIYFMRLYAVEADAWDAFLSVSFIFAIVPIDARRTLSTLSGIPASPRYGFLRDLESSEPFLICSHFL